MNLLTAKQIKEMGNYSITESPKEGVVYVYLLLSERSEIMRRLSVCEDALRSIACEERSIESIRRNCGGNECATDTETARDALAELRKP